MFCSQSNTSCHLFSSLDGDDKVALLAIFMSLKYWTISHAVKTSVTSGRSIFTAPETNTESVSTGFGWSFASLCDGWIWPSPGSLLKCRCGECKKKNKRLRCSIKNDKIVSPPSHSFSFPFFSDGVSAAFHYCSWLRTMAQLRSINY